MTKRVDWGRVVWQFLLIGPLLEKARVLGVVLIMTVIGVPLGALALWFRDRIAPALAISDGTATNICGALVFTTLIAIGLWRSR